MTNGMGSCAARSEETEARSVAQTGPATKFASRRLGRQRPLIAFFDYADVFEDFYPHYGVDQQTFATRWAATGGHAILRLVQSEVGDVIWYVFSLAATVSEARHEVVGCRVRFLPSSWLHRRLWRLFYLPRAAWRWRGMYRSFATVASYIAPLSWRFLRMLVHDRPDCIFVASYSSGRFDMLLLLARMLGVPLVAIHIGGQPEGYLGARIRRWTLPAADRLIASGYDEFEMLATRFGAPRDRIRVILTPIDTNTFQPMERTAACRAAGLDPADRYLLFVGRLQDSVKRVSALIKTFATLAPRWKGVNLVIAGDGPDQEELKRLAAELAPDRVRFLGWVSEVEEKVRLYNAAECLVLPSWREGFPTVVGEAMACGTPVLASRVGAVGELVKEGKTGWLVPPGDDQALVKGLAYILEHPEATASMRPRAREITEDRVSPAAVAAALRECFALEGRPHG